MKKHIGDRRRQARFEVVGRLTGSLETRERWAVRNMGEGGALVETALPLVIGAKFGGRLSHRGQTQEVRGEARHILTAAARDGGMPYLTGVQWDTSVDLTDFVSRMPAKTAQTPPDQGTDRRATGRVTPGPETEIDLARWSTVEVVDISTIGVLLATHQALDVGERGELRIRLGEHSFAAHLEIRRTDTRRTSGMSHGVGASFVSLDDSKRVQLEDFIGDARR